MDFLSYFHFYHMNYPGYITAIAGIKWPGIVNTMGLTFPRQGSQQPWKSLKTWKMKKTFSIVKIIEFHNIKFPHVKD